MPRGGKRTGAGRRKVEPENKPSSPRKGLASEVLSSLGGKFRNHPADCNCEGCIWKDDAEQKGSAGRPARMYLWDRADGKPTQMQEDKIIFDPNQPLRVEIEHIGRPQDKAAAKAK